MSNIWCIGQVFDALITNSAVSFASGDGTIWQSGNAPFFPKDDGTSLVWNNNVLVAGSSSGNVSINSNYSTWTNGLMGPQGFSITGMTVSSNYFSCGQRHYLTPGDGYNTGAEVAQIFKSFSGGPGTYNLVFTEGDDPSIFYNMKYFSNASADGNTFEPILVAVGDHVGSPFICYSTNDGSSWIQVSVPDKFLGSFFDVEYDVSNNQWLFGAEGEVVISSNLTLPTWHTSINFGDVSLSNVIKIMKNPDGQTIAVTPSALWYTNDLENWNSFSVAGYTWKSVIWFNNRWIAGAQSLLTQYTFWTSLDAITWIPFNNNIQAVSYTLSV